MHQAMQLGGQDHQQADAIENSLGPQPIQDMTPPTIGPSPIYKWATIALGPLETTHTHHTKHTHTENHLTQPHLPVSQH